ncbi:tetratricopeptide repeat protein 17-like isoform X3 [Mercenaria mercenaria]|uniref:tetratricopeptide repeat protein 17-like isoform X3 n=1 Tax=Mercenaria mercenaria TaxID=6596 RepID=UPI00234F9303|nr:tetratricopeptide repeat protein 17-like isoform X3 [Mercenaria mercenaria]
MAAQIAVLISLNLIFSNIRLSQASTHWVVTEDGKVQSQMDSVFNMKRPYDLVAFMKQEERANMLDKLKQELLSRKVEIDSTEDRDTGLEEKFYKTDPDCLAAGKQLPDLDLYISTVLPLENKGIRPEDFLPRFVPGSFLMQPDCTQYIDLPYSPYAYEHLDGMRDRRKLPGSPELGLKNAITYQDNVDEYGHRIYEAFKKNQTSWILYNMAAFYWRIKGDPYNVIECVRRALHYSPRMQKDVALISLANVLHRAQKSNEAAIVVHAAIDVSRELNVNHFTLGNIYAVLGEYNKSVICFENTLRIQPDFEAAAKRKHAVICHAKLESALEAQHRSLQRTLNDLKDYQRKHDFWQQQSDKLLAEQVPLEVKLSQHVAYEELKIKELSSEIGKKKKKFNKGREYCRMGGKEGKQVLMCSWRRKADPEIEMDLTVPADKPAQDNIKEEEKSVKTEPEPVSLRDYTKPVRGHKYTFETVKVPRYQGVTPDYLNEEWPSKEECDLHVQKVPDARNLTSTYLPPENKGYEVKPLLNEFLGLKEGDEHPLPWFPPVCVTLLDIPEDNPRSHDDIYSVSLEMRKTIPLGLKDHYHTELLLSYVNDGKVTIEELGQRILSGLKKRDGPKWIFYNLAGLYWRIIGNNYHAIECFRRSVYTAPFDVLDVPDINLANILYRWAQYDDALELSKYSLRLSQYEPAAQFLIGNIEWAKKNYTGAIWRYQLALEAEPNYVEVVNTLRDLKCYLRYHQAAQSAVPVEVLSNCPALMGQDMSQSESRVICRHEAGEEKCVIETRTRGNSGESEGSCTQTCTVGPVTDTCSSQQAVEGPEGHSHGTCGQCNSCCNRCSKCAPPPSNSCQHPKGPIEQTSHMTADGILFDSLDDDEDENEDKDSEEQATEKNMDENGHCPEGEDCSKVKVQQTPPHIKLEFINGQLFQKLIFAQSPNELTVRAEECVIFNDGTKSEGCSRPEFRAYRPKL